MAKNRQYIRQSGKKGGFRGKDKEEELESQIVEEQYEGDDELIDLSDEIEQATDFWEKHQKTIIGVIAALLFIIGAIVVYKYLVQAPKEKEAVNAIHKAQYQFERDSFALALENPGGGFEGFLDIIDNYSGTPTANLAKYYAGISYLNLGKYDAALEYLGEYNSHDDLTPITKYGAMGDAHAELGAMDKAKSMYEKAIGAGNNNYLTPIYLQKLAILQNQNGDASAATKTYERIVNDYPDSQQAKDADKYAFQ